MLESEYRGFPSIVLETDRMAVELIPELGAKIVSMRYKPTGKEWLIDAGQRELRKLSYGESFEKADLSGWDECFPTVNACAVDKVGGSVNLPDHGEVWPLPWACRIVGSEVVCSVLGVSMPYRLTRTMAFVADDTLRMSYCVENTGESALPFLWVPHPQFAVKEPTLIELPASMTDALCVFGRLTDRRGATRPWRELSPVGMTPNGDGRKYYAPGRVAEGWCALRGERSGDWLRMSVDAAVVPYLGVWIDEGMVNDRNAIALEPSIGYYDRLDRAIANGSAGIVQPGGVCEWSLEVRLGSGHVTL